MAGTAVAIPEVPAHLAAYVQQHQDENDSAAGGIKAGSWPRISIGGSKFTIKEGGEARLICDPKNPDLPLMQLELVVLGHNPMVSKTYYEGEWEEGDKDEPTCSSDDGIAPDAHVAQKQSTACATCRQNQWGSKISRSSGKQVKACNDNKRLVVANVADLRGAALEFSVKPASLKDWKNYVDELNKRKIPVSSVVTLIYFDPVATYPKCLYKFGRFLTAEELAIVADRKGGDDVLLIASPRRTGTQSPTIPIVPSPLPPAAPQPPAPVAPPPPAVVDPYEGTAVHVKPAVEAAGGLLTEAGRMTYKALVGKDAPVAAAPPPAPAPVEPPKPVDPYEGQPTHVKLAVEAAGGLASDAGKTTYKALAGKDAPGAEPEKAKRGRKAAPPAAPVTAPVPAPPPADPAVAPTPAQPGYAAAPAGAVATPGNPEMDIDKLLADALKV